jgi:type IV pilus assembly protein PilB
MIVMAQKKLGELLLEAHAITADELGRALEIQQSSGERLGSILLRLEMVDSKMLSSALGKQQDVEGVDLREVKPSKEALGLVKGLVARRLGCIPLWLEGEVLAVAMVDPRDEAVVLELAQHTGKRIKRMIAPQTMIYSAIVQSYGGGVRM